MRLVEEAVVRWEEPVVVGPGVCTAVGLLRAVWVLVVALVVGVGWGLVVGSFWGAECVVVEEWSAAGYVVQAELLGACGIAVARSVVQAELLGACGIAVARSVVVAERRVVSLLFSWIGLCSLLWCR